jgi:GNAT superfamily N-acetyltransferase
MEKKVITLTGQHLAECAWVLAQAFQNDPAFSALGIGLNSRSGQQLMTGYFTASLSTCVRKGQPIQVRDHDQTTAVASIYPPGTYPTPLMEQVRMFSESLWRAGLFRRATWTMMKRAIIYLDDFKHVHPKQDHYYLEFLGVLPGCQRQGLGSLMVKTLMQIADQEQVGCYLETSNLSALHLYQRLGFNVTGEKDMIGVPSWFMWRSPQIPPQ